MKYPRVDLIGDEVKCWNVWWADSSSSAGIVSMIIFNYFSAEGDEVLSASFGWG